MRLQHKWPFLVRNRPSLPPPHPPDNPNQKTIIGWRELVHLPEWGLFSVPAKADTGARTCAIDVEDIEELGPDRVRFEVVLSRAPGGLRKVLEASVCRRSRVRSSLGDDHARVFVATTLSLADRRVEVEIGLVSRESMISRMLLGRQCLGGIFLVDSERKYLHGQSIPTSAVPRRT